MAVLCQSCRTDAFADAICGWASALICTTSPGRHERWIGTYFPAGGVSEPPGYVTRVECDQSGTRRNSVKSVACSGETVRVTAPSQGYFVVCRTRIGVPSSNFQFSSELSYR